MLRFWVPRTASSEAAMLNGFRPVLARRFDVDTENITLSILKALSRYENVDDLDTDTIRDILVNDALRDRLAQEEDIEQEVKLVYNELIAQMGRTSERLRQEKEAAELLRQELEEERLQSEGLAGELEETREQASHEIAVLTTKLSQLGSEIESQRTAYEGRISELESEKSDQSDRMASLERELKRIEEESAARDAANQKRTQTWVFGGIALTLFLLMSAGSLLITWFVDNLLPESIVVRPEVQYAVIFVPLALGYLELIGRLDKPFTAIHDTRGHRWFLQYTRLSSKAWRALLVAVGSKALALIVNHVYKLFVVAGPQ